MSNIIVSFVNEVLAVDSRLIADQLGIEHSNGLMRTIRKYENDFQELGHLVFETQAVENSVGAVNQAVFCYLNEDQAYYAVTLSRNTEEARKCKMNLVKAFSQARKQSPDNSQIIGLLVEQQEKLQKLDEQNQLLLADKTETEEIGTLVKSEYQGLVQLIQVTFGNISDYYSEKINKLYPQNKGNYYTLRQIAYKFFDLNDSQLHDLVCKARCNINGIYHNLTGKYLPTKTITYVFGKAEVLFALWKLVLASEDLNIDLGVSFTVNKEIEELERLLNTEDF